MSDDYLDIDPHTGRPRTSEPEAYPLETVDEVHDFHHWHESQASIRELEDEKDAAVAAAFEAAAQEVDCGCEGRSAVLVAATKADRWRACGTDPCGAEAAQDVRELAPKDAHSALARVRDEALREAAEAWDQLRYVAVQNTDDPEEWAALIDRMDAAFTPAPMSVKEAAQVIMRSKDARNAALDAMWEVAEKHSLEATNSGGALYSVTWDAVNELYYAALRALAGEGE